MKLWLLRPNEVFDSLHDSKINPWDPWYDKAFGFVIRAETEERARKIANNNGGDEGKDIWLNKDYSLCIELTSDGDEEMIIRDFASA